MKLILYLPLLFYRRVPIKNSSTTMITSLSAVSTLTVLLNCYEAEIQSEASVKVDKETFNDWNDIPSIISQNQTDVDGCSICRNLRDTIDKAGASRLANAISRYLISTTKPEWIAGYFAWMKISMLADNEDCCANAVDRALYGVAEYCRMNNNAKLADWILKCYDYLTAAAMLGNDLYASFVAEDIDLCRKVAGRVSDIVDTIEEYPTLVETFHKLICREATMPSEFPNL